MRKDYEAIVKKYSPPYIKLRWKSKKNGRIVLKPAHACIRRAEILSPRPTTPHSLAFFLHECAHFWLRHFKPEETDDALLREIYTGGQTATLAEQEYAAERWAIETMKREGISVPKKVLMSAKEYVADCLSEDTAKKRSPKHVKRWIS